MKTEDIIKRLDELKLSSNKVHVADHNKLKENNKTYNKRVELAYTVKDLNDDLQNVSSYADDLKFETSEGANKIKLLNSISFFVSNAIDKANKGEKLVTDLGSGELVISKQLQELGLSDSDVKELAKSKQARKELQKRADDLRDIAKKIKSKAKSI